MLETTYSQTDHRPVAVWGAVWSMALCVALLIASEFMPVSLLTPMAKGLGASVGQTGQAISISGLFAVGASLLITTVAGRLNRKAVLIALTGLMLLSLVMIALAQSFAVLMIARALLGLSIGGFWALATSVVMRLVPGSEVPRALSLMYSGQAVAAAFAAPLGSFLGDVIGWRGVFWALTPIVVVNLTWHMIALPSLPTDRTQNLSTLLAVARRPYFARGLVAAMLSWGAAFTMFTYLRPYLEQVTQVDVTTLSVLLLVLGCAGFVGTWTSGRFLGANAAEYLKLPALVMGAVSLALIFAGPWPIIAGILLCIWGAMNTALSVIFMTWMSQNVSDAPEEGGSLMVAAIQGSILLGAVFGGLLLDGGSIFATLGGSVALSLAGVALIGNGQKMLKTGSQQV